MAKLLIRVGDDVSDDAFTDMQLLKHGDVVAVAEDSHEWGGAEIALSCFRDIQLPGPRSDYVHLLEAEPATIDDFYPKSLLRIPGMITRLSRNPAIKGGKRRPRKHNLDDTNTVSRKPAIAHLKRRTPDAN